MLSRQSLIGSIMYPGGIMSVPEPFAWSWGQMVAFTEDALCQENEHIHWDRTKLSLHDHARNDLVRRTKGEWLIMLDCDMSFEPDIAARLVMTAAKYNVDVLTGIYSFKRPPHYPVLYMWNPDTERHEIIANWDRTVEIFQIHSAGAGCLFVRRKVFERIVEELKENPFDRIGAKGEDHSFFTRLRKLDIKAYCAPHIETQHLEYLGITPSVNYQFDGVRDHEFEVADVVRAG